MKHAISTTLLIFISTSRAMYERFISQSIMELIENGTREEDLAPNSVVLKALDEILSKKFSNKQFKYEIEKASGKGDNYLGVVYRITAHIEGQEDFKLIIKTPPENIFRRKAFCAVESFNREALAYTKFLPLLIEFQKSKGLEQNEMFKAFPECYGVIYEEFNEAIFLEDLCVSGYSMFDRFKELDLKRVTLIMQAYAKLHATGFAIQDQEPQKLAEFKQLTEIFEMNNSDMFIPYFESLKQRALSALDDETDAKYKQKLAAYLEEKDNFKLFLRLLNGDKMEPNAVVCHGDCWNNNLLYKYDEQQQAVDAMIVDWQILRYASPITDIMYFLFSSTQRSFRQQHYDDMLNVYYDALRAHMEKLDSDPDKIFPRSVFEQQVQKYGFIGFMFAMLTLSIITAVPEETPDLNEMGKLIEDAKIKQEFDPESADAFFPKSTTNAFNQRMRDVILDIFDFGYMS